MPRGLHSNQFTPKKIILKFKHLNEKDFKKFYDSVDAALDNLYRSTATDNKDDLQNRILDIQQNLQGARDIEIYNDDDPVILRIFCNNKKYLGKSAACKLERMVKQAQYGSFIGM